MSLTNYTDLTAALGNWLDHSLYAARYDEFIALFEATANRRLKTRLMERLTILVPSNPPLINVTGADNNGAGLIRLAVTDASTFATGDLVTVANVNGTTEANGTWLATSIDGTHIDLQGSTFTNVYSGSGTVREPAGWAALPSDFSTWRRVTWTGQPRRELSYVHPSYFQAAYPSFPAETPAVFTIEGSTLKVMPTSSTPLELDYWAGLVPLSMSNQTNWMMTTHPDAYLFGALAEAENFGVNDERMGLWKARRDEVLQEIETADMQRHAPSYIRVFGVTP